MLGFSICGLLAFLQQIALGLGQKRKTMLGRLAMTYLFKMDKILKYIGFGLKH